MKAPGSKRLAQLFFELIRVFVCLTYQVSPFSFRPNEMKLTTNSLITQKP